MPSKRLQKELEQNNETVRSDELLNALRKKPPTVPRKTIMPRVRFTGQQPGEEVVEKDEKPGLDDVEDADDRSAKKDENGEVREPSTEGKFSA